MWQQTDIGASYMAAYLNDTGLTPAEVYAIMPYVRPREFPRVIIVWWDENSDNENIVMDNKKDGD